MLKVTFLNVKSYISNQYKAINHTYRHKKTYLEVEKQLLGKNTISGYLHDTNKLIMYALLVPVKFAHKIHRKLSPHHVKNGKVRRPVDAVIDWVSKDPLTAREFYEKKYAPIPKIEEVLKRFKL